MSAGSIVPDTASQHDRPLHLRPPSQDVHMRTRVQMKGSTQRLHVDAYSRLVSSI